ncbi:hypothetical protein QVD17_08915 [Tagetes erecta]|uniref:Uncharacterized protein n=1 Tax=Tagetes erecta TaxID=13708 RepID=A0AAD8P3G4_TARER|nr:hypothetical protein QVD17_08915 [Tagetes erecta]
MFMSLSMPKYDWGFCLQVRSWVFDMKGHLTQFCKLTPLNCQMPILTVSDLYISYDGGNICYVKDPGFICICSNYGATEQCSFEQDGVSTGKTQVNIMIREKMKRRSGRSCEDDSERLEKRKQGFTD